MTTEQQLIAAKDRAYAALQPIQDAGPYVRWDATWQARWNAAFKNCYAAIHALDQLRGTQSLIGPAELIKEQP